jgi:hypothetical protein
MSKEYVAFVDNPNDLPMGQEIELSIRDLTPGRQKYDGHNVRAIIADSPDKLPGSDVLWFRSLVGILYPKPWAIKIIAELDEFIPKRPYSDYEL